jgi:WD40 repeat protein
MSPQCRRLVLVAGVALSLSPWAHTSPPPADTKPAPKKEELPRTDRYGDPLPPGAIARLGTTRLRHDDCDYISAVAFSPDGRILASAGAARLWEGTVHEEPYRVRLWDVIAGKEIRRLAGNAIGVESIAFSPDGKLLASADRRDGVRLWEIGTGKNVRQFDVRASWAVFSPDGSLLIASGFGEKTIHCWDMATGKQLPPFQGRGLEATGLALSPDGKILAAASADQSLRLWEVDTRKELRTLREEGVGRLSSIAFSPDGKALLSPKGHNELGQWETGTGKQVRKISWEGGDEEITHLAFSPGGQTLAWGTTDGRIVFWDIAAGKVLRQLHCHRKSITSLAFTSNGKSLASGSSDKTVRLWDTATGRERLPPVGHAAKVSVAAYSPDGRTLATAGLDGTVRLWDWHTGEPSHVFQDVPRPVDCLAFARDGKRLAAKCGGKLIYLWDVATGKELKPFPGLKDAITMVALYPDGRALVSGGKERQARLWDVPAGKELGAISWKGDWADIRGAFSPDGKVLATASYKPKVQLWDVATGRPRGELRGGKKYGVSFVAFSPDERVVAATGPDGAVYVWDLGTGKELSVFTRHREGGLYFGGSAIAFSPDGRFLATTSHFYEFGLWEVATGEPVGFWKRPPTPTDDSLDAALAFSPDGRTVACGGGGDYAVLIWDVTGLLQDGRLPLRKWAAREMADLWVDLADGQAPAAYQATWKLAASEQTVGFLRERLHPVPVADPEQVARLLHELDSDRFGVRDQAAQQLEDLRDGIEPALARALAGRPSLEFRRRVERLLAELSPTAPKRLRELRAVTALEYLGTPEARRLLQDLAAGAANSRLTREAKAALERLRKGSTRP